MKCLLWSNMTIHINHDNGQLGDNLISVYICFRCLRFRGSVATLPDLLKIS